MQEDKNYYRNLFKSNRKSIDKKQKRDRTISDALLATDEVKNAKTVLLYISSADEIDTYYLIERLISSDKSLAAPVCFGRQLKFFTFDSADNFKKGAFGILEPDISACDELKDFQNSVCVTPMLGGDLGGYRMGYGGGFYDRFFVSYSGIKIGLCYYMNMTEALPYEQFDLPLDVIVTEKKLFRFC